MDGNKSYAGRRNNVMLPRTMHWVSWNRIGVGIDGSEKKKSIWDPVRPGHGRYW